MVEAVASLAGPGPALDVAAATSLRVLPNAEQQAAFLRTAAERLTSGGRLVVDQHEINPAGYAGSSRRPEPPSVGVRTPARGQSARVAGRLVDAWWPGARRRSTING